MKNIPLAICLLFFQNLLFAQKTITLKNPSFEDMPSASAAPRGWIACGMKDESACDVQPGSYGCKLPPAHGNTYVGMVTRDNYTWEGISQKLSAPLDSSVCYTFTIQLATSSEYNSYARLTREPANYNEPVIFRLWGGYGDCDYQVLLAESSIIAHHEWKRYGFTMRHLQSKPLTHLMFEAYYPSGRRCNPSLGNLLMDELSDITLTKCPTNLVDTVSSKVVRKLPVLESEKDLDVMLIKALASIRYSSRGEVKFVLQCGEDTRGVVVLYSSHLLTVADAMLQFPDKKLILRTKNAKGNTRKPRAAYLKNYLLSAGLPESQIEVMPYDEDEKSDWKVNTSWLSAKW